MGFLLKYLKRYNEAEAEFRKTIEINPEDADVHYNLGDLFLETGRIRDAKKELEIAVKLFKEQGRKADAKTVEELLQ